MQIFNIVVFKPYLRIVYQSQQQLSTGQYRYGHTMSPSTLTRLVHTASRSSGRVRTACLSLIGIQWLLASEGKHHRLQVRLLCKSIDIFLSVKITYVIFIVIDNCFLRSYSIFCFLSPVGKYNFSLIFSSKVSLSSSNKKAFTLQLTWSFCL